MLLTDLHLDRIAFQKVVSPKCQSIVFYQGTWALVVRLLIQISVVDSEYVCV